jgi:hypothetical protein
VAQLFEELFDLSRLPAWHGEGFMVFRFFHVL